MFCLCSPHRDWQQHSVWTESFSICCNCAAWPFSLAHIFSFSPMGVCKHASSSSARPCLHTNWRLSHVYVCFMWPQRMCLFVGSPVAFAVNCMPVASPARPIALTQFSIWSSVLSPQTEAPLQNLHLHEPLSLFLHNEVSAKRIWISFFFLPCLRCTFDIKYHHVP